MKFDTPATANPTDRMKVLGKPLDRVDGKLKTTGTAHYAYERNDAAPNAAYGYIVGSAIAKGRIEDHSIAGARVARQFCPRLGFSAAETETVAWLIEVHLVMSSVAQSRISRAKSSSRGSPIDAK